METIEIGFGARERAVLTVLFPRHRRSRYVRRRISRGKIDLLT